MEYIKQLNYRTIALMTNSTAVQLNFITALYVIPLYSIIEID